MAKEGSMIEYRGDWTQEENEYSDLLQGEIKKKKASSKIQSRVRGNLSRRNTAIDYGPTKHILTKDWPKIKKSMIEEGFSEEDIGQFYKDHYMRASNKKKKPKKKPKKKSKKKFKKKSKKKTKKKSKKK